MRGQQERSGSLFSYVSIVERIPTSHPLRRIRKLADQALDRLNPTFCELYASEGRPSVPPEQLLLASLLQAFYGIRSERLLLEQLNRVWSWDISFLPTTVKGVWLYLYLVVDVWSRKVVAWDVAEVESAEIAADLVQRACLKERYRRPSGFGSHQCHARDNAGIAAGGDGGTQILLPAQGLQRQPVLGILVPNGQIPARLPQPALCQQGLGLRVGGGTCGLVQPPASSQRHQIRHTPSAS
jgi:hypothetical protein